MRKLGKQQLPLLLTISLCCCGTAFASPVGYTDQASFMSDLSTNGYSANVLDFDSSIYGDIINSGTPIDGITFSYDFGGVSMMVTDDSLEPTTSAPNLLGTDDGDMLQDTDDFSLSFVSSNAIGMYFISGDEMVDDDIFLTAQGLSVGLNAAIKKDLGSDWYAYFIGIIDTDAPFTDADVRYGDYADVNFLYTMDDIVTTSPVPEPQTLVLFACGLLTLIGVVRKRRK